ncbi:MAG: anti-sigma factor family protein, partial [Myxococcaceae bacterium]
DDELQSPEAERLRLHLDGCQDCRAGWQSYEKTVKSLRRTTREKAPPHLSSQIMRRVRRERLFGWRGTLRAHNVHRVPIESIIPVLLGVAVAVWLMFVA